MLVPHRLRVTWVSGACWARLLPSAAKHGGARHSRALQVRVPALPASAPGRQRSLCRRSRRRLRDSLPSWPWLTISHICVSNAAACPLFAAMLAMALSSPARGMAAARPLPCHSMAQRSLVAAARPSGHGCSRLRAGARVCSPVAAASSGIGSWAAPKAAWQALLGLLAGASAGVPEWKWWAAQLGAVALMAAAACKVVDNSAKKEFEERCQCEEVSRVRLQKHLQLPALGLPTGGGDSLQRRQLRAAQLTTTLLFACRSRQPSWRRCAPSRAS